MLDHLGTLTRTDTCGALRADDDGRQVTLLGWVNRRRDHGNLIFLDLRDRYGVTQIVLDRDLAPDGHAKAEHVRPEYVVAAIGAVRLRGAGATNPNMPTGEIEVVARELLVLNDAKLAPFSPAEDAIANEEVRLKYRYIDLRRAEMQRNFLVRHRVAFAVRSYLSANGFLEVETPMMTRSTPEGARDYLVPSRVHAGEFYALPQSPQLFKQILMISGFDRYFQIARCFRDEDLRADRQPEFTQIDLEMSFPQQEMIFRVVEGFMAAAFAAVGIALPVPFPEITYDEAMRRFGIDKPDLRLPGLTDVRDAFAAEDLQSLGVNPQLPVVVVRVPGVGELSRKERDENRPLFDAGNGPKLGAKLLDDLKRLERSFPAAVSELRQRSEAGENDLLVLVAGDTASQVKLSETKSPGRLSEREIGVLSAAGNLRVELARKYAERHGAFAETERVVAEAGARLVQSPVGAVGSGVGNSGAAGAAGVSVTGDAGNNGGIDGSTAFRPIWVTDFPMFEQDADTGRWLPSHHPFTSPHEADMDRLQSDPASVRARYYDLAMNGLELGSGSIRIHRKDVQARIFEALGMTDDEARERFGFFLDALEYGTPPHGGIALGLDRIAMILAGAGSLREVIAFPKTAKAIDLMVDAPTRATDGQLRELHIRTSGKS